MCRTEKEKGGKMEKMEKEKIELGSDN